MEKKIIPQKTVALTVDAAYKSIYTEAFSRLKKLNLLFTVFTNHSISHDYLVSRDDEDKKA
ncbi:MAG: hypothetical protein WC390_00980 [Sulfurimonas sp.]